MAAVRCWGNRSASTKNRPPPPPRMPLAALTHRSTATSFLPARASVNLTAPSHKTSNVSSSIAPTVAAASPSRAAAPLARWAASRASAASSAGVAVSTAAAAAAAACDAKSPLSPDTAWRRLDS